MKKVPTAKQFKEMNDNRKTVADKLIKHMTQRGFYKHCTYEESKKQCTSTAFRMMNSRKKKYPDVNWKSSFDFLHKIADASLSFKKGNYSEQVPFSIRMGVSISGSKIKNSIGFHLYYNKDLRFDQNKIVSSVILRNYLKTKTKSTKKESTYIKLNLDKFYTAMTLKEFCMEAIKYRLLENDNSFTNYIVRKMKDKYIQHKKDIGKYDATKHMPLEKR